MSYLIFKDRQDHTGLTDMIQAANMVKTLAKTTKRQEWAGLAAVRCRNRSSRLVKWWLPGGRVFGCGQATQGVMWMHLDHRLARNEERGTPSSSWVTPMR